MFSFADEFIAGQIACRDGKECPESASDWFKRGYSTEQARHKILIKEVDYEQR